MGIIAFLWNIIETIAISTYRIMMIVGEKIANILSFIFIKIGVKKPEDLRVDKNVYDGTLNYISTDPMIYKKVLYMATVIFVVGVFIIAVRELFFGISIPKVSSKPNTNGTSTNETTVKETEKEED